MYCGHVTEANHSEDSENDIIFLICFTQASSAYYYMV